MKATGIVRRVDDLGRVVIPKEIRRTLRIREGDPLELFTTRDGEVVFKKYVYCDEKEWHKAKEIVKVLTEIPFALYDNYGELKEMSKGNMPTYCDSANNAIFANGDIVGFIYFDGDILEEDVDKIKEVLKKFLTEE